MAETTQLSEEVKVGVKRSAEEIKGHFDKKRKLLEDDLNEDLKGMEKDMALTLRRQHFQQAFQRLAMVYGGCAPNSSDAVLEEISTIQCSECKRPELTWLTPHAPSHHRLSLMPGGCKCNVILCDVCLFQRIRTTISFALHLVIQCPKCEHCIVYKGKHMFIGQYTFTKVDSEAAGEEIDMCPFALGTERRRLHSSLFN